MPYLPVTFICITLSQQTPKKGTGVLVYARNTEFAWSSLLVRIHTRAATPIQAGSPGGRFMTLLGFFYC